jgi:hypothetical protein
MKSQGECFKIHKYSSYEDYKLIQTEANKRKIDRVWVNEENVKHISDYILKSCGNINYGLCHGTRRGYEQAWFSKYLNCEVIGTEISDTATDFPNTIMWDFHDMKEEWLSNVDFIYSNSFDHSYKPEECLNTWMSCLNKKGICILEHSSNHLPERCSEVDPFIATLEYMPYLIAKWSRGKFGCIDIFEGPQLVGEKHSSYYIIIKNC